jgi:molybdenum ABC transporter molybdate-binding protein
MFGRPGRSRPFLLTLGGSVAVLAVLCGLLWWVQARTEGPEDAGPLLVHCAPALARPLEELKRLYEAEAGQRVDLNFGRSGELLAGLELKGGDVFLPADDSYVTRANKKGLTAETVLLARMSVVVAVRPGFPRKIAAWRDLIADDVRLGLADPRTAAVTVVAREHLRQGPRWGEIQARRPPNLGSVDEAATAVRLGTVDASLLWDAVAAQHPGITVVRLPELEQARGSVAGAVVKASNQPAAAKRFLDFLASERGRDVFRRLGYEVPDEPPPEEGKRPELLLYAGAMLRPAIEETVKDFERRENVRVTRVYNGCGILVTQMKAGERPDLYFACDPQFMRQVADLFDEPEVVSGNQLVIAVPKGNPLGLKSLRDLGRKPGPGERPLRVGVGHEQQCALGAISRETFLQSGLYKAIRANVVVESPTGDLLINQLRAGSLDAVVAYRSNVVPYPDAVEGVPITGIPCAVARQPLAVGKGTAHPELAERLRLALRSEERARDRFKALGFAWKPLTVYADPRLRELAQDLAAVYEEATGQSVDLRLATARELAETLEVSPQGELVLTTSDALLQTLGKEKLLERTSPLARREEEGKEEVLRLARLSCAARPDDARRFVRFGLGRFQGAVVLKRHGYKAEEEGAEVELFADPLLARALGPLLRRFEEDEKVRVERVVGDSSLLAARAAGRKRAPDLFLADDAASLSGPARELLEAPRPLGATRLALAVAAGNPKRLTGLADLAAPGVRLGVVGEQADRLLADGPALRRNLAVRASVAAELVAMLRDGAVDAALVPHAAVAGAEGVEAVPLARAPTLRPALAVARRPGDAELTRKLAALLRSAEGRAALEKGGFEAPRWWQRR